MTQPVTADVTTRREDMPARPTGRTGTPEPWTGSALWPTFMRRTLPVEEVLAGSPAPSVRRIVPVPDATKLG